MNHDILRSWLGLRDQCWPPDAYALLGVRQGETDVASIEQCVHERLCKLRCYQLSHPEEATEGMNRLAQAFIQVTDAISRTIERRATPVTVAVARLPRCGERSAPPAKRKPDLSKEDTAVARKTEIDWRQAPPPVRVPAAADLDTVDEKLQQTDEIVSPPPPPDEPPPSAIEAAPSTPAVSPEQEAVRLAWHSPEARLSRLTLPALLDRISQTRQVALAWKHVGKYICNPQRRLSRTAEETDLTRRMDLLFETMEDYPAFVGHPGKPGYRVVAMARLEMTALMFKSLDGSQREELARDWHAGARVLREHHRYLLRQLKTMKRRGSVQRACSAAADFTRRHRVWFALGALALAGLAFVAFKP